MKKLIVILIGLLLVTSAFGQTKVNKRIMLESLHSKVALTDTIPLFAFGAGAGIARDTASFRVAAIYGAVYLSGSDTLVITEMRNVLRGTNPSIAVDIMWHATMGSASAVHLNTTPPTITSVTTGDVDVSFNNAEIPPGVWIWWKTSTVTTQPTYWSCTLSGYKRNLSY